MLQACTHTTSFIYNCTQRDLEIISLLSASPLSQCSSPVIKLILQPLLIESKL